MRLGRAVAVSSALLFLLGAFGPHHMSSQVQSHVRSDMPTPVRMVISEFYPYALAGDEYVTVTNVGGLDASMLDCSLSDGEGTITFTSNMILAPGNSMSVSFNSTSYERAYGRLPEVALDAPEETWPCRISGTFRLANSGDSIEFRTADGEIVDFVCYGETDPSEGVWKGPPVPCLRPGEVAKRMQGVVVLADTDSSEDWTPFRQHKYGYTSFGCETFDLGPGEAMCFVSPDCALGPVLRSIDEAMESVRVCAYELNSPRFVRALGAAVDRGVSVRVLVEGKPVGGMSDAQVAALSWLDVAGAEVYIIDGVIAKGVARHMGALHAKYVVVDRSVAVIGSENFVDPSLSEDPVHGNRGWWARFASEEVARFLDAVFESDCRPDRQDVVEWGIDERHDASAALPDIVEVEHPEPLVDTFTTAHSSRVTLFVSPDCSVERPYILDELSSCSGCLAEQLEVDLLWTDRWTGETAPSPVLEAYLGVLRRGGEGRLLLDSSWFGMESNLEVVEHLRACAEREGLSGEFALLSQESPVEALHNKGLVLDYDRTLISSNNWVHSSFFANRELAVLLQSEEAAQYFTSVFDLDWYPDDAPPIADAGPDGRAVLGGTVRLSAADSTDDRVITGYAWDIGADGTTDGSECTIEFAATRPGRLLVLLTVEDSWGNTATDTVVIEVVPELSPVAEPGPVDAGAAGCAAALGAVCGVLLARRGAARRAHSRPRKINHQRAAFQRCDADPAVRARGYPGSHEDSEGLVG